MCSSGGLACMRLCILPSAPDQTELKDSGHSSRSNKKTTFFFFFLLFYQRNLHFFFKAKQELGAGEGCQMIDFLLQCNANPAFFGGRSMGQLTPREKAEVTEELTVSVWPFLARKTGVLLDYEQRYQLIQGLMTLFSFLLTFLGVPRSS